MWQTILAVAGASIGIAFTLSINSHVRQRATNSPGSLAFYFIQVMDAAYETTIFRPLTRISKETVVTSNIPVHQNSIATTEHLNIPDKTTATIERACSISIRLGKDIRSVLRWFGHPGKQLVTLQIFWFFLAILILPSKQPLVVFGFRVAGAASAPDAVAISAFAFLAAFLLGFVSWSRMTSERSRGLLNVLFNLYCMPLIFVFITRDRITIGSAWLKTIVQNTEAIRFESVEGTLVWELMITFGSSRSPMVIFSLPTFIARLAVEEGFLRSLSEKLNLLAQQTREMPFEEMLSGASGASAAVVNERAVSPA